MGIMPGIAPGNMGGIPGMGIIGGIPGIIGMPGGIAMFGGGMKPLLGKAPGCPFPWPPLGA